MRDELRIVEHVRRVPLRQRASISARSVPRFERGANRARGGVVEHEDVDPHVRIEHHAHASGCGMADFPFDTIWVYVFTVGTACRRASMIIVLSPAKSLDYETPPHVKKHTLPEFVDDAAELIDGLRKLSPQQIGSLMRHFRPARATELSALRRLVAALRHATTRSRPCSRSMATCTRVSTRRRCPPADLDYAQNHVRVLSGLYGLLRPLDLLQPYRLEMGTKLRQCARQGPVRVLGRAHHGGAQRAVEEAARRRACW